MGKSYKNIPEADVLLNKIEDRKKKGLYSLTFASGLPGTGKSSACLRLAELTSIKLTGKNIITEKNVFDSLIELVRFVRKAKPKEVNIGVIEEVSVLFPSRRAMASDNLAIGKLLDTARKKEIILFANAPIWPSIDSHLRALGNFYLETLSINKEEGVVISKCLRLQTNPGSGKTYFHWLLRNGREVNRIITRKPSKETWNAYESKKDKFMEDLYNKLEFESEEKGKKLENKMLLANGKVKKPLSPQEMQVYDLVIRQNKTQLEVSKDLGISGARICKIMKNVKKKMQITKENGHINVNKVGGVALNESI